MSFRESEKKIYGSLRENVFGKKSDFYKLQKRLIKVFREAVELKNIYIGQQRRN